MIGFVFVLHWKFSEHPPHGFLGAGGDLQGERGGWGQPGGLAERGTAGSVQESRDKAVLLNLSLLLPLGTV